jgi:ATP-dependent RNA helicase DDX3X
VYLIEDHKKKEALFDLVTSTPPARTLVFVNSKRTADLLDDHFFNQEYPSTSFHSDRTQREREDAL